MYDLETGMTRSIDEVNSPRAESFHNWNANSHWFLFTSRRDDGLYTRVYISSIGKDGKATKPFLLPQRHPKRYYSQSFYSFNTPDFTSRPVGSNARERGRKIESEQRVKTTVTNKNPHFE